MYLMYYEDDEGNRTYTLKVRLTSADPAVATASVLHPMFQLQADGA